MAGNNLFNKQKKKKKKFMKQRRPIFWWKNSGDKHSERNSRGKQFEKKKF